jgi:LysM repeat protein
MSTITLSPAYVARPAVSTVRLTRRGRLVVFLLALGVVLTAALLLSGRSTATSESGRDVPTVKVTVEPGQTLWGISSEVADDGDVRAMVDRIEQLNALDDSMLYAGQELFVPAE